jgi:hypothetical protein
MGDDEQLAKLFDGLPAQGSLPDPKAAAWLEDGRLVEDEQERGSIQIGRGDVVDDPVLRTQRLLQTKLGAMFPYTRAVCYGFLAN